MIVGIGIDLVDITRVRKSLDRWGDRWTSKIFTDAERAACEKSPDPARTYASGFAAKEAAFKALPNQPRIFYPRQFEVVHDEARRPSIRLHSSTRDAEGCFDNLKPHLSITNENETAAAVVVIEIFEPIAKLLS